ncbi:MAG: 3-methyl-2-oxobutanoate hydroxymethyltransferase [Candidatus Saganbacteria bacterium]|nr:3-methyl-2-oxobutanoate hydroxymethyltransferase [Candidatus Saganbacteria bacterium]
MEKTQTQKRKTAKTVKSLKNHRKISMLTAYDYPFAKLLDEAGIDIILVGDSLGNVGLGYKNTLPVTLTEMIIHTQAVSRAVNQAMVVTDMPFGTFQQGPKHALSCAIDLIKAGAQAVKIEGAQHLDSIKAIIRAGIPVMGHLGFTPQSVNQLGYSIQGKSKLQTSNIKKDAKRLEKLGCFSVVLELVPPDLAKQVSSSLKIPVIGIGAGPHCDGQVLVTHDLLGLYPNPPSFVKKQANLNPLIKKALQKFIKSI